MSEKIMAKVEYLEAYDENEISKMIDYSICKNNIFYDILSRILDVLLSLIGLTIGIPLIVIFGVLVKLEDGGPIIYKQERLGKDGKLFNIYKVRSMRIDAEKFGVQWAQNNDSRVLKVGRFIRKTRIDEIPQLFNILKGDMSIVGPRPERPMFTMQFNEEVDGFVNRLSVKPGLTGLAQVNGGYEMTPKEKLEWDIKYIENKDILIYLKIIIKTIKIILTGYGAR